MKTKSFSLLGMICLIAAVAGLLGVAAMSDVAPTVRAADSEDRATQPAPVEDDMHEFMEYVFQPAYKRLKTAMASEPKDNQTWKTVKSDGLILAEGGNLLLIRTPEEDANAWNTYAADVRDLGGELYRSAKKKEYAAAHKHYTAMLEKCNSCHQKFADGEHQLKP